MKTSMIFKAGIALLLVVGLSFNTSASNDPTSTTVATMEESMAGVMQLKVPSDMETFVSVFDQEGEMIYTDLVSKDDEAGKMYDFSEVENGQYTFRAVSEHKSVETTFVIEMNELRVLKEEISYRPVFWIEGNILSISYMNLEQNDVYLSLEDDLFADVDSNLYYEEITESDMSYERVFDIKNLGKGEYSITLRSGDNTYNYFFNR